jgi:hypothetical protein
MQSLSPFIRAFNLLAFLPIGLGLRWNAAVDETLAGVKAPTLEELSTFAKRGGFVIPSKAQGLRFANARAGEGDVIWLPIQLPVSDVQRLVKSNPATQKGIQKGDNKAEVAL